MKDFTISKNRLIEFISIISVFIVWEIISLLINNNFILPSPEFTVRRMIIIISSKAFLPSITGSLLRGLGGFLLSCIMGIIFGIISGLNNNTEKFIQPYMVIVRSTPVVSIIILAVFWFKKDTVPIFISFLVSFPIVYSNVSEGIKAVDEKLIQMAKVYKIKKYRVITNIYFPSIFSYLTAGFSTAIGIGWKAVIAAEIFSQPKYAIGTQLINAKMYLNIEDALAWTMIVIILSFIFEKFIRYFEGKSIKWR